MHGTDVSDVTERASSDYDGCDPGDHVLERHPAMPFFPRCRICKYTVQSLTTWWGQDLDEVRS